jgi:uncharacterized metal-binding protein
MTTGRIHSQAVFTAATCFAVVSVAKSDPSLLWTSAGAFVGLLINPDLDQNASTISDFFILTIPKIGKPIGWFWRSYTWTYRHLFKHRSFFTHTPIVGTVIRIAYFGWWMYFAIQSLPLEFVTGLIAADVLHWLLDMKMFSRIL